jgi:hypothetical protein
MEDIAFINWYTDVIPLIKIARPELTDMQYELLVNKTWDIIRGAQSITSDTDFEAGFNFESELVPKNLTIFQRFIRNTKYIVQKEWPDLSNTHYIRLMAIDWTICRSKLQPENFDADLLQYRKFFEDRLVTMREDFPNLSPEDYVECIVQEW